MFKSIAIWATLALALGSPAAAQEIPQAVKDACQGDYEKHCSAHDPESTAARECMAGVFDKLSDPCVTAILDSPLAEQEQQRVADARASDEAAAAKKPARKMKYAKPVKRIAKAKRAAPAKYSVAKKKRHYARRAIGPHRSVAGFLRRGTRTAGRYVAKYTRFALSRVFR